jgi:hypothetical protein
MDMKFGTWNVRSLYREGSLITDGKEISKNKLDSVEYRRSDGTKGAPNQHANIHFSIERGMRIMN